MAIQFNCPNCEAVIRVPDAAAGKKGTCPRCNEKLLVPDIVPSNPASAANAIPTPGAQPRPEKVEQLPQFDASPIPGLPQLDPVLKSTLPDVPLPVTPQAKSPGLPRLSIGVPASIDIEPPRRAQARRKTNPGAWIVPILCIGGVAGFLGWYVWSMQPKMEGSLTAHVIRDFEMHPGMIPGEMSGLKSNELAEVLRHLKAQPAHWASTTSKITLTGTDEGVAVSIDNTPAAHFVSVVPGQNPVLVDYMSKHLDELEKLRLASLKKNAPALFLAWKRQFTKNDPMDGQVEHRDLVILPTLVAGLGYHVEALVNGNLYPCVHEDSEGTLYFLLPNATKSFQLKGRKVPGGLNVPANFTVKISGSASSAAPAARKKSKRKTAEERELENEGMSSELEQSGSPDTSTGETETPEGEPGEMSSEEMPDGPAKSKKPAKKKPAMMDDDNEMMNDEMPEKAMPKKKPVTQKKVSFNSRQTRHLGPVLT